MIRFACVQCGAVVEANAECTCRLRQRPQQPKTVKRPAKPRRTKPGGRRG